ncbi:hypothetical protein ACFQ9V_00905 [Leifsonia sp. NPDC056665]|uniref:hypothetical protein n=1 Tax=Leifsonia sp. NPDC056665 TaxID=3345901 RepID=UPI00369C043D
MAARTTTTAGRRRPDTDFSGVQTALGDLGYRLSVDEVRRVVDLVLKERAERLGAAGGHAEHEADAESARFETRRGALDDDEESPT